MTELLIVRHGKTAWNLEQRIQGSTDTELHPIGIRQAEALARRLAQEEFHAIYSSSLKRAYQTAERIAGKTSHRVILHDGLRERNFGIFEGLTADEIQRQYPEAWKRFKNWDPDYTIPQGVSLREYQQKSVQHLERIAGKHPDERLVIVTHGAFLSVLMRYTLQIPFSRPRRFRGVNTALNIFVFDEGGWTLRTWGDTSHLRRIDDTVT
ncbi:alpha-ribazole phosphatase [candidate division KSB3 bacterium]|uniref:Alpha-ribazole phosphatase n=1 Tax=candidate division KSB3 bacterium TaxID=2044937 RepID=A0A2G6E2U8_9BACT|nr:MAG: alpha-ribazole phosphatase [candidate division KSB3 bacterium]PIE28850.1 MAG: alpha-ribazole phosphatase [candidate division KSB3 bacterium]